MTLGSTIFCGGDTRPRSSAVLEDWHISSHTSQVMMSRL
jgi:hypothetical protein